ncbi:hypothetical protein ACFQ0M_43765 [Kitasatospora aburaviensis]
MSMRTLALPALVVSVVLALSACDPTSPTAQPADHGAAVQAAPVPVDGNPPAPPAPGANPPVTLVAPAADRAPSATPSPVASSATPVAVPSGTRSAAPIASGAPTAAALSPSGTPTVAAGAADLELTSYDRQTGKAVLAVVANEGKGAPTPSATAAATAAVQTGRLIDSPPSAAAPEGALLAITAVKPAGAGKVQVDTRPATISELLGQTWANIKAALDPHKIQVTPRVKDLKVSYVPKSDGAAARPRPR